MVVVYRRCRYANAYYIYLVGVCIRNINTKKYIELEHYLVVLQSQEIG